MGWIGLSKDIDGRTVKWQACLLHYSKTVEWPLWYAPSCVTGSLTEKGILKNCIPASLGPCESTQ